MKYLLSGLFIVTLFVCSCKPWGEPRNVDWKKEWEKNQTRLKALAGDILTQGSKKYIIGNNNFPADFDYPFDDGFAIRTPYSLNGATSIDTKNITITFYVDRGLLDHYSAFIYTNDSTKIKEFNENVQNGGNDFKIEPGWYIIND